MNLPIPKLGTVKLPGEISEKYFKDFSHIALPIKAKESKEEPKLQFRCAGPNPSKKCGHRDEKKKGGMVKKGMHKMSGGKMMKDSDMKKGKK